MNWLRHHSKAVVSFLGILVIAYVIAVTIFYVYGKYGFEAQLQYGALLLTGATLSVTVMLVALTTSNLEFMKRDIEARVRPFLSVNEIKELKREDAVNKFYSFNLRNTGIVPAKSVQVIALRVNTETRANERLMRQNLPLIAPNQEIPLVIHVDRSALQEAIDAGVYNLELTFEYEGIEKTYWTKQSFRIATHDQMSGLLFIPTDPSNAT